MVIKTGIRLKIFLSFFLLVVFISFAFTATSYFRITDTMNKEIKKHGIDVVKTFSQLAAPYIFEYDYVTIKDIASQLVHNSDFEFITIFDREGKVWLSTNPDHDKVAFDDNYYKSIKPETTVYRYTTRQGQNVLEFTSPISALGKVSYLVTTETALTKIEKETVIRIQEAIIICISMIIFSSLIGLYLSRILTAPIKQLVRGTSEISRGNFSYKINVTSSDEIAALSKSFNLMTDQLKRESITRKDAENKLIEHLDNLELIIRERTEELRQANNQLSDEIKEKNRTAAALKKSEERYKRLAEVTTEGIALHDKNHIIDCNSSFENLFGYSLEELTGKEKLATLFSSDFPEPIETEQVVSTGYHEATARRKDGTSFPVRVQSLAIDSAPDRIWVTSVLDITEQKKLEEKIHQSQKLESIGLMAGGVAHDLNNILTGITGYPELILKKLPETSELREPLGAVQEAGERAAAVVADLLTIARGAAYTKEPHNLNSLVMEYFASPECKKLQTLHSNVIFQHELSAKRPVFLCSPVHIKKCLMNLVNNAAEAFIDKGTITVSTSNQYIGDTVQTTKEELKPGEYVTLKVQDTGTGISKTDLEHIFEPFYTKKIIGRSGTGLGLTIVWNTTRDHDGKISVESNEHGTGFTLYFPVSKNEKTDLEEDRGKGYLPGFGERILVVDDEPQPRDIACQMLEHFGYRVDAVSSGEQAIEFIRKTPVDLIVLDMLMEPGMNGRQTYEEIVKIYSNQKAIIASGFSGSADVKAALKLGVNGFIKKPYSMQQLGQAVKEALYG